MSKDDDAIIPHPLKPHTADVIDLAGVRVRWGTPKKRDADRCEHKKLIFCESDQRVWCEDCERTIENFRAFMTLVKGFREMERDARYRQAKLDEALAATIHRRATKAIDRAWSGNLCAIACVHCGGGLLPEDYANGARSRTSRELELQRRKRATAKGQP